MLHVTERKAHLSQRNLLRSDWRLTEIYTNCVNVKWDGKFKRAPCFFAVASVCLDPKDQATDCYFCLTKVQSLTNRKSNKYIVYPEPDAEDDALSPDPSHDETCGGSSPNFWTTVDLNGMEWPSSSNVMSSLFHILTTESYDDISGLLKSLCVKSESKEWRQNSLCFACLCKFY